MRSLSIELFDLPSSVNNVLCRVLVDFFHLRRRQSEKKKGELNRKGIEEAKKSTYSVFPGLVLGGVQVVLGFD
jgi:hypothetical protein